MDFALRCAFAHGTGAIRTHLDSIGAQTAISWPVFAELREDWRGRIALQATVAVPDRRRARRDEPRSARSCAIDGALRRRARRRHLHGPGARTRRPTARSTGSSQAAAAEGLDLDFHVDESGAPEARTLERIADAVIRNRFTGKVLCGHCCSLALLPEDDLARVVAKVAEARLAVVEPADVQPLPAGPARRAAPRAGAASRRCTSSRPPASP